MALHNIPKDRQPQMLRRVKGKHCLSANFAITAEHEPTADSPMQMNQYYPYLGPTVKIARAAELQMESNHTHPDQSQLCWADPDTPPGLEATISTSIEDSFRKVAPRHLVNRDHRKFSVVDANLIFPVQAQVHPRRADFVTPPLLKPETSTSMRDQYMATVSQNLSRQNHRHVSVVDAKFILPVKFPSPCIEYTGSRRARNVLSKTPRIVKASTVPHCKTKLFISRWKWLPKWLRRRRGEISGSSRPIHRNGKAGNQKLRRHSSLNIFGAESQGPQLRVANPTIAKPRYPAPAFLNTEPLGSHTPNGPPTDFSKPPPNPETLANQLDHVQRQFTVASANLEHAKERADHFEKEVGRLQLEVSSHRRSLTSQERINMLMKELDALQEELNKQTSKTIESQATLEHWKLWYEKLMHQSASTSQGSSSTSSTADSTPVEGLAMSSANTTEDQEPQTSTKHDDRASTSSLHDPSEVEGFADAQSEIAGIFNSKFMGSYTNSDTLIERALCPRSPKCIKRSRTWDEKEFKLEEVVSTSDSNHVDLPPVVHRIAISTPAETEDTLLWMSEMKIDFNTWEWSSVPNLQLNESCDT